MSITEKQLEIARAEQTADEYIDGLERTAKSDYPNMFMDIDRMPRPALIFFNLAPNGVTDDPTSSVITFTTPVADTTPESINQALHDAVKNFDPVKVFRDNWNPDNKSVWEQDPREYLQQLDYFASQLGGIAVKSREYLDEWLAVDYPPSSQAIRTASLIQQWLDDKRGPVTLYKDHVGMKQSEFTFATDIPSSPYVDSVTMTIPTVDVTVEYVATTLLNGARRHADSQLFQEAAETMLKDRSLLQGDYVGKTFDLQLKRVSDSLVVSGFTPKPSQKLTEVDVKNPENGEYVSPLIRWKEYKANPMREIAHALGEEIKAVSFNYQNAEHDPAKPSKEHMTKLLQPFVEARNKARRLAQREILAR